MFRDRQGNRANPQRVQALEQFGAIEAAFTVVAECAFAEVGAGAAAERGDTKVILINVDCI